MCRELEKGKRAHEGRRHGFYFAILHHQSWGWSELCFLTARNQKWHKEGKKINSAADNACPGSRISTKVPALFLPSLKGRGAMMAKLTEARELQWLEMSLSLKYPTSFQTEWLRGEQPEAQKTRLVSLGRSGALQPQHWLGSHHKGICFIQVQPKGTLQRPPLPSRHNWSSKIPGRKSRAGFSGKLGPGLWGKGRLGLEKEWGGGGREKRGETLWKEEIRDSIRKGGPI